MTEAQIIKLLDQLRAENEALIYKYDNDEAKIFLPKRAAMKANLAAQGVNDPRIVKAINFDHRVQVTP